MATSMKRFGSTVCQVRSKRGLTQAEAARRADLSAALWVQIERGERSPNLAVLEDIAEALEVPACILVFLASDGSEFERVDERVAESVALLSRKLLETQDLPGGDAE